MAERDRLLSDQPAKSGLLGSNPSPSVSCKWRWLGFEGSRDRAFCLGWSDGEEDQHSLGAAGGRPGVPSGARDGGRQIPAPPLHRLDNGGGFNERLCAPFP